MIYTTQLQTYKPANPINLDRSHPFMRNCIGYWPMTEGKGTVVRDLIKGNHGDFDSATEWRLRNVLQDDSSNAGIQLPYHYKEFIEADYKSAVCKFVYYGSSPDGGVGRLFTVLYATASSYLGLCIENSTRKVRLLYRNTSGGFVSKDTGDSIDVGKAYTLAAVCKGSNAYVYLDGVQIDSVSNLGQTQSAQANATIGRYVTTETLDGEIHFLQFNLTAFSGATLKDISRNPWAAFSKKILIPVAGGTPPASNNGAAAYYYRQQMAAF